MDRQSPILFALITACLAAAVCSPRPASAQEATPAGSTDAVRKAYERLPPVMVEVRVQVLEDRDTAYEKRSRLDAQFDQFTRQRIPMRLAGVRVAADGTVLVRDPNLPLDRYGEIEFVASDGTVTNARFDAVLKNHAALLLKPTRPPAEPPPHLTFAPASVKPGDRLLIAWPTFLERSLAVRIEQVNAATVAVQTEGVPARIYWWQKFSYPTSLGVSSAVAPVVLDDEASPLGIALDNALWETDDGADSWIGAEIMSGKQLSGEALDRIAEVVRRRAERGVREIRVQFRTDSRYAQQLNLEEGELFLYGVLLDEKGRLFVPTTLTAPVVRQIERIMVTNGEEAIEAAFEGLFSDLGAMIVRAPAVGGATAMTFDEAALPRGKLFYTLSVRRRYGRREDRVEYNRYLDRNIGYKDVRHPEPQKPLQVGDLIADADGRLIGFFAPVYYEKQDVIRARLAGYTGRQSLQTRIFLFSEVAATLSNPFPHYDRTARPMTRKEERAIMWLGVEYQPMSAALARILEAEGPTRDGARGLLVTHVYDNSPATRIGVEKGDILLAIQVEGAEAEIDLVDRTSGPQRARYGETGLRALWRSRRNNLTAVLTLLGKGRSVRARYLHNGEERVVPVVVEQAPDDFSSADEYMDDAIGLAVKQMTYEVRAALRWPTDAAGVVVSNIEPGNKAAVARIMPFEIVTRVNGEAVLSPGEFRRRMREAVGRGSVELLVVNLGRSRIVELDLTGGSM